MPLHEDNPDAEGNLTTEEYEAKLDEMAARAAAAGEPVCQASVPADEVAAAIARLDAANG